jgi:hypothetical protein
LEPIYYSEDQKHVVVGGINYYSLQWYRSIRTTTLSDALAWKEGLAALGEREAAGLYGISWLFVHWMYHRHRAALGRFLDELRAGTAPERAFEIALPNFDVEAVDRELFQYQMYFRFARFDQDLLPLRETPISESSLQEYLLGPPETEEVKELLANAAQALAGRPHPFPRRNEEPLPPGIDYAALPMLPQYPCGPDEGTIGPSLDARMDHRQEASKLPFVDALPAPLRRSSRDRTPSAIPPAVVARVIRGADEELRACYEEGLRKNALLGGKITLQFVIAQDGEVSEVRPVCTSLPDPAVVTCMVERFAKFRFPKSSEGRVHVIYPLMFTPAVDFEPVERSKRPR